MSEPQSIKTKVRQVRWIPAYGGSIAYFLSVALWVPLSVLPLVLLAEDQLGWGLAAMFCALGVHFTPHDMALSACSEQGRSAVGWWALKAQLWLLFGGAISQASKALRATPPQS